MIKIWLFGFCETNYLKCNCNHFVQTRHDKITINILSEVLHTDGYNINGAWFAFRSVLVIDAKNMQLYEATRDANISQRGETKFMNPSGS